MTEQEQEPVSHRVLMFLGDLAVGLTPPSLLLVLVDDPTPAMYVLAAFAGMAAVMAWTHNRRQADD